ncbi:hypothetical protein D9758_012710 [Tetrapyrgos nigripes]|uniref:Uncharacterized protein n=1 Tax=Tetrapyrgos nigripes TaxID=182062 RepID=A0A8H5CW24_9AGAR|nr:hypothetical protein D9758_012710 [Tetrapyrgos nigripes]
MVQFLPPEASTLRNLHTFSTQLPMLALLKKIVLGSASPTAAPGSRMTSSGARPKVPLFGSLFCISIFVAHWTPIPTLHTLPPYTISHIHTYAPNCTHSTIKTAPSYETLSNHGRRVRVWETGVGASASMYSAVTVSSTPPTSVDTSSGLAATVKASGSASGVSRGGVLALCSLALAATPTIANNPGLTNECSTKGSERGVRRTRLGIAGI